MLKARDECMNSIHAHTHPHTAQYTHTHIHWRRHWNFGPCVHVLFTSLDRLLVRTAVVAFVWVVFFSFFFIHVCFALSHRCRANFLLHTCNLALDFGFDATQAVGSAIDRTRSLLSVSSWSWISWEQCRSAHVQRNYFSLDISQRKISKRMCVFQMIVCANDNSSDFW